MKNIKELLIKIKPLLTQKAIVLSAGAIIVTGAAIGGGFIYMNKSDDVTIPENGKEISQSIDENKTEENNVDVDNKENSNEEIKSTEENKSTEDTSKKEEVKEEVKVDNGTSDSGNSSGTSDETPTPTPTPTPPPTPEPTPTPPPVVPSRPSGWDSSMASQLFNSLAIPGRTNNVNGSTINQAHFNFFNEQAQSFVNGTSASTVKGKLENTSFDYGNGRHVKFEKVGVGIATGYSLEELTNNSYNVLQTVNTLFVKVYFDGNSKMYSAYLVCGVSW